MLSKNFRINHKLDVDLCTEFPCMICRQDWTARRLSNKRAIPLHVQVWGKLQGKAVGLKLGVRATPKALRRGDAP